MKRTSKKWLLLLVVMGILSSGIMTTFAYTEESVQETVAPIVEEAPSEREVTPFSMPGNGQLVDDLSDDTTKQFLTVRTKNGNTFFLIVDRSSNTENVYMLSWIDENDLAEFLEETEPMEEIAPVIVIEPETTSAVEEPEAEQKESSRNRGTGTMAVAILLLVGGAGSYYYVKVLKPKKEEEEAESEGLEFYDSRVYRKEEQEDSSNHNKEE